MEEEKHSPLEFLKPTVSSVGIFLFLIIIHLLGSYGNAPFSDQSISFQPPIFYEYYQALPGVVTFLFWLLWVVISTPLFIVGRVFIYGMAYVGINIYDYLNDVVVFIIFLLYYYFLASVIISAVKKPHE